MPSPKKNNSMVDSLIAGARLHYPAFRRVVSC